MKARIVLGLAVLMTFLVGGLMVGRADAAPPAVVTSGPPGRWQIVNGTPEQAGNIMLLDSATGQTWVICTDEQGTRIWCSLERSVFPSSVRK